MDFTIVNRHSIRRETEEYAREYSQKQSDATTDGFFFLARAVIKFVLRVASTLENAPGK